jgi:DNA recombination protein RmuC
MPELVDLAAQNNVILASPSTLIGLLRAIHVGHREKQLTDKAQELFELGRELHERSAIVLEKVGSLGRSLDHARGEYNEFVGSLRSRLLPTLRKFELGGARSGKELKEPSFVEGELRDGARLGQFDATLSPAPRRASGADVLAEGESQTSR